MAQQLPPGWIIQSDRSNRTYYYNRATGQTTWERPRQPTYSHAPAVVPPVGAQSSQLPLGWAAHRDPKTGRTYYVDTMTGASQCKSPPALLLLLTNLTLLLLLESFSLSFISLVYVFLCVCVYVCVIFNTYYCSFLLLYYRDLTSNSTIAGWLASIKRSYHRTIVLCK